MITFPVVEIFESLQGEGYNTGMPAVFLRFGGCNLACKWCDTDFQTYRRLPLESIMQKLDAYSTKNIIITGGEPTLQTKLPILLAQLKIKGYFIMIETNGLKDIDPQINYVAISPKFVYRHKYHTLPPRKSDEVRIVVEDHADFHHFCLFIQKKITAKYYFLSPCEQNDKFNILTTLNTLGKLNKTRRYNKWLLSLQTHKLANIK